jgi:cob(I)alamin adenosyltransferase
MKTRREEKLEEKLIKVQNNLQDVRRELHTSQQKNRDMAKSRDSYKAQVKHNAGTIKQLQDELKKKPLTVCLPEYP